MKKLFIVLALVAAAPSVNAAVDCVKPLSDYGYQLAEQYPVYRAYRGEFDKWLFAMCRSGEETRGIDPTAANAKMNMEAARYMRAYFNEVPEGAMRDGLTALLSLAGWSGYTGEAWPPAPTKAAANNAAADKAAADKAAAAKAAAAKKAAASKTANAGAANSRDISNYLGEVQAAIRGKLNNWDSFKGKRCTLRLNLSRDAVLLGAKSEGGDPALCAAMLDSMKHVEFPKFPNDDVYNIFKNAPLDFMP